MASGGEEVRGPTSVAVPVDGTGTASVAPVMAPLVSVSVQKYSVQYKGYNLIGVTTVEVSTTRGMTALVYCLIKSSLYTGTVQRWWSTPYWLDGQ
jgi:hypothetical protein